MCLLFIKMRYIIEIVKVRTHFDMFYEENIKNRENIQKTEGQFDKNTQKIKRGEGNMPETLFSVFQDERFMDLTLYQCGYEKCQPLHSFGPYVRNHYLFHYIISGKGTLYSDDREKNMTVYSLSGGEGFLIEPGLSNMYTADKEEPWEYIWVEFGGLRAREFMEVSGLSQATPVYRPNKPSDGDALCELLFSIVRNGESSSLRQIGNLYLVMDMLIGTSGLKKQFQNGRLSEFYAREAVAYIEQNYFRNITVEDMARRCSLDRSYFGKIFKKTVGQSPQEFLIRYRMAKAAEALKIGDASVSDIGTAVGYPNQLHFSRAFKNVYGMAPRDYRNKYRILEKQFP